MTVTVPEENKYNTAHVLHIYILYQNGETTV